MPYEQMRDPLESRPPQFTGSWFVQHDEEPHLREKQLFEFYGGTHSVFQLVHLLALTIDATDYTPAAEKFAKGWARPRMWEHYAENHAGVCLAFDKARLTENLTTDLKSQLGVKPYYREVDTAKQGARATTTSSSASSPTRWTTPSSASDRSRKEGHHQALGGGKAPAPSRVAFRRPDSSSPLIAAHLAARSPSTGNPVDL